jgi:D-glycero-D-manno-heptose 1,7-bisphosphate phosphatase
VSRCAVFVDRDGVLIRDVDHLTAASQIEVLPGVPEALRRLRDAGWAVVVVTNQSVVARGLVTENELRQIHRVMERQLRERGAILDAIYYCPHHPEGTVARYRAVCDCRKPEPGMLLRAAKDLDLDLAVSVMVGDTPSDMQAGRRAGCRTVLIGPGAAALVQQAGDGSLGARATADHLSSNLQEAAEWILRSRNSG